MDEAGIALSYVPTRRRTAGRFGFGNMADGRPSLCVLCLATIWLGTRHRWLFARPRRLPLGCRERLP